MRSLLTPPDSPMWGHLAAIFHFSLSAQFRHPYHHVSTSGGGGPLPPVRRSLRLLGGGNYINRTREKAGFCRHSCRSSHLIRYNTYKVLTFSEQCLGCMLLEATIMKSKKFFAFLTLSALLTLCLTASAWAAMSDEDFVQLCDGGSAPRYMFHGDGR